MKRSKSSLKSATLGVALMCTFQAVIDNCFGMPHLRSSRYQSVVFRDEVNFLSVLLDPEHN